MIIQAKERGGGAQLARYLSATRDNDHVEIHDLRGFVSKELVNAFKEADAIAEGTRCQNHLFSVSLNPPPGSTVYSHDFEEAADAIEKKLGLEGQPRAIVFHEKDGRRHAHVVWSKIDTARMRAINLSHYKLKLNDISREIFRNKGWDMPKGLQNYQDRNPLTYTHAEYQQARRAGLDPQGIKAAFKNAWEKSDSREAFTQALKEKGFWLARGDRRGFVALDYQGNVHSVSRRAGIKAWEVKARLGDPSALPSVEEVKKEIAWRMTDTLRSYIRDVEADAKRPSPSTEFTKEEMISRHGMERKALHDALETRRIAETIVRTARLSKGFKGIWHRLTGRHAKIIERNEREAWKAHLRDRTESDALINKQLTERDHLQRRINEQRARQQAELLQLRADVAHYQGLDQSVDRARERDDAKQERLERRSRTRRSRGGRQRGPGPEIQ